MFKPITMKHDSVGLLCIGLAVVFLIAILYGHIRRERFTSEANAWTTIQHEVEADLQTFLVFDVAMFRKNTSDQKAFFAILDGKSNEIMDTSLIQSVVDAINVVATIRSPSTSEDPSGNELLKPYFTGTFNIDKPFDTRMALLDAQYAYAIANNKKGSMLDIQSRYAIPGVKHALKAAARVYMSSLQFGLLNAKADVRKGNEGVLSGILGS